MTREELIAEIRRQDAAYEDIDLSGKSNWELDYLLDYIESDPENPEFEG